MRSVCLHISLLVLYTFSFLGAAAQVSIKLSTDRDKILIGEPVMLSVNAYVPPGSEVVWFSSDSIDHFMVTKRAPVDTVHTIDTKKIVQVLTITSFDSGRWTISPFEINVGGKPYYSDSLIIDVAFISFDPKEAYHDIKDIIVVENPSLKYIPWMVLATALVALGLTLFFWRNVKKPAAAAANTISRLSAYEEAMNALDLLQAQGTVSGNEKIYYSQLNAILRTYVSHKFGISTIERTNDELILQLTTKRIPPKSFSSLVQSLRISDFVKFAKYRPSESDNAENLSAVRSSIDILNTYTGSAV